MVIKSSSAAEIRTLVAALSAEDEVRREAASARLAVIGARAVERLLSTYDQARERHQRVAILRILEAIGDHRAGSAARSALAEAGDIAMAAAGVLRALLESPHGNAARDALDALTGVALDERADRRLRVAAVDALQSTRDGVHSSLADALRQDPVLGARLSPSEGDAAAADAVWSAALDGQLPDDPHALGEALTTKAGSAAFGVLQKLIDAVRAREQSADAIEQAEGWRSVRGSIHHTLALRGSRVALYDLRESLEPGARLPGSFLAAVQILGDRSCLEPLAAAYSRADHADETWRDRIASAFRAVAERERVTKRHAAWKRIAARWPGARELAEWTPRRRLHPG